MDLQRDPQYEGTREVTQVKKSSQGDFHAKNPLKYTAPAINYPVINLSEKALRVSSLQKIKEELPSSGVEHIDASTPIKTLLSNSKKSLSMSCTHTNKILIFTSGSMQLKSFVQLLK